ncbi:YrdB family protein [Streptomyces coacervatus]|uniref:YrdB family protein n=1 Tax=Streptomyces coacervatus TaxID=647381 RepID=A0ABP7IM32_9ACTN
MVYAMVPVCRVCIIGRSKSWRRRGPAGDTSAVKTAKAANLGVLFLIELGALAAVGYWGFTRDVATPLAWLLGLGAPAVLIVLWALFGSQKASHKTRGAVRVGFELLWFGAGVAALLAAGAAGWAIAFAAVCAVSKTLAVIWRQ